jgi:glycosyltransferase involved in cell wall biosynthesis
MEDDDPRLLRTEYVNLTRASWWAGLHLDGIVLYGWGLPRYTPIARAIKEAGIPLFLYLDAIGLWSPWTNGMDFVRNYWTYSTRSFPGLLGWLRFAVIARSYFPPALDLPRLRKLSLADAVGLPSPWALDSTRRYAQFYGFDSLLPKLHLTPPPIDPVMTYAGQPKQNRVICVGRWHRPDWAQKNPALLLEALTLFLRQNPGSSAIIVGGGAQALGQTRWARPILEQNLPVRFLDHLPHAQLVDLLATSRISICSSTYEAAHLTSFEALCCGCSIVTTTGPALPSVYWGARENGTIASGPDAPALAQALADETQAWDQGKRDPHASSRTWSQRVHAPQAAAHALRLLVNS